MILIEQLPAFMHDEFVSARSNIVRGQTVWKRRAGKRSRPLCQRIIADGHVRMGH